MGSRYLTDLAAVCRAAGLLVTEYPNWQTRARGSGGYEPGRPTAVMVHHTASPPSWSGQRDADYCAVGDEDAPLSNLCLDRSGMVWVLAAGATNTNGKGSDWWGGGVPDDSMNSYAIGIEANGGYGEPWPTVQTDAYITLVCALLDAYHIDGNCVRGHFEWAPTRKVDPAGPSKWSTTSASWNMDGFRADCIGGAQPIPPTPAPLEEVTMLRAAKNADSGNAYYVGTGSGPATWVGGDDAKESALVVAGGVIDVKSERIVYRWADVGAIPAGDVRRYVGDF